MSTDPAGPDPQDDSEAQPRGPMPYDDPTAYYFDDHEPIDPSTIFGNLFIIEDGIYPHGEQGERIEPADRRAGRSADEDDPDLDNLLNGAGGEFVWLTVDDPRMANYVRPEPPMGLSPQVKARRKMALELTDALADPPFRQYGGGHDWAHAAMQVPITYRPVMRMLEEVESVTEAAILVPGETQVVTGYENDHGLVIRVHGPHWSLVFTTHGAACEVYVCSDDVIEVPLKVKMDAAAWNVLPDMVAIVFGQLQRISLVGDKRPSNPDLARQDQ